MHRKDSFSIGVAILTLFFASACDRSTRQAENAGTATPERAGEATTGATAERRSDTEISTQVQSRFYGDGDIRGRDIDVRTEGGVVTLTGTVQSEQQKQRALQIAQQVQGVTRVNDQLMVNASTTDRASADRTPAATEARGERRDVDDRNPGWVTTKIQAKYYANPDIKPWNIDVTTHEGGLVTLNGRVESEQDRAKAVQIAQSTEGVRRVEDQLRVVPDDAVGTSGRDADDRTDAPGQAARGAERAGQGVEDAWITTKLQSKYFLDDEVRGRNINVNTENGVVSLQGEVRSESERRQALALARSTDGVSGVRDQLRVVPEASGDVDRRGTSGREMSRDARREGGRAVQGVDDTWITTKIQSKFFMDDKVRASRVNVDTKNGVVTLRGSVDSESARQMAETIARETDGVSRVVNQLTVSAGNKSTDQSSR